MGMMKDEQMAAAIMEKPPLVRRARDLKVFQKAYALPLSLHQASLGFPKIEQYALADQLRRSSKSVCANIAESSAEEVCVWLNYALDLDYIAKKQFDHWDGEYMIVAAMLSKFRQNLQ